MLAFLVFACIAIVILYWIYGAVGEFFETRRYQRMARKNSYDDDGWPSPSTSSKLLGVPPSRARMSERASRLLERAKSDDLYSKVVGVTQRNTNGRPRQQVVKDLKVGETLSLVREPFNPHDRNAIRVNSAGGEQVGYINRDVAEPLSEILDSGTRVRVIVSALTGGEHENYGVNIKITA